MAPVAIIAARTREEMATMANVADGHPNFSVQFLNTNSASGLFVFYIAPGQPGKALDPCFLRSSWTTICLAQLFTAAQDGKTRDIPGCQSL
jgi:hypothetical protein